MMAHIAKTDPRDPSKVVALCGADLTPADVIWTEKPPVNCSECMRLNAGSVVHFADFGHSPECGRGQAHDTTTIHYAKVTCIHCLRIMTIKPQTTQVERRTEERRVGVKHDKGKPGWFAWWKLVPWEQFRHVGHVLINGAKKYAPNNWKLVDNHEERYLDAMQRHLDARMRGEIYDPEWGLPHLAHAVCCALFMMWFDDQRGDSAAHDTHDTPK